MSDVPVDFQYAVKKFGLPTGGEKLERDHLRPIDDLAPKQYLDFLMEVGTGVWNKGYFQIVDPLRFAPIVDQIFGDDKELPAQNLIAIGHSAFGHLLCWSRSYWNTSVDPLFHLVSSPFVFGAKSNISDAKSLGADLALSDELANDTYDSDGKALFKRLLSAHGPLKPGQVYAPRLHPALGGPRSLENFRPAGALEALSIAAQAAPFTLKDVLGKPPKPSRIIGG